MASPSPEKRPQAGSQILTVRLLAFHSNHETFVSSAARFPFGQLLFGQPRYKKPKTVKGCLRLIARATLGCVFTNPLDHLQASPRLEAISIMF